MRLFEDMLFGTEKERKQFDAWPKLRKAAAPPVGGAVAGPLGAVAGKAAGAAAPGVVGALGGLNIAIGLGKGASGRYCRCCRKKNKARLQPAPNNGAQQMSAAQAAGQSAYAWV